MEFFQSRCLSESSVVAADSADYERNFALDSQAIEYECSMLTEEVPQLAKSIIRMPDF